MRLYTYLPKENTADTDGLLSTSLTPDGWKKYQGRTGKATKEEVLAALDSFNPDLVRSRTLSAFSEPIPAEAHPDFRAFADAKHLYSFDTKDLIHAAILERIHGINVDRRGTHRVSRPSGKKIDWSKKEPREFLFSAVPHYLVQLKGGKVPPELVRDEEKKAAARIDIPKIYDEVRMAYGDLGYPITGDRLVVSSQPTYTNGKPVPTDVLRPNASGGNTQDDGTVRINPEYRKVMRHWKLRGSGRDFLRMIIGHELGHHIDRTQFGYSQRNARRRALLKEIADKKFHTAYTDSYGPDTDPRKLHKELLAEYLGHMAAGHKVKAISFPDEEIPALKGRDELYTTRVSDDRKAYDKGDRVISPWGRGYTVAEKTELNGLAEHPFIKELTDEQRKLLGRYRRMALLKLVKGAEDTSYTVRKTKGSKVTPEQLKRLIALAKQLDEAEAGYEGTYGLKPKGFDERYFKKRLKFQNAYLARNNGDIVGMALSFPPDKNAYYKDTDYISMMSVDAQHRNRGIGRKLLRAAILDSVKARRTPMIAVDANNQAAMHLYESEGFTPFAHTMVYQGEKKASFADKVASVLRKAAAPVAAAALAAAPTAARGAYPAPLNNPGNMRDYGVKWRGAVKPGSRYGKFIQFDTPQNGARAVSRNLTTLGTKRGIPFTLRGVMGKYSPKTENKLDQHVKNVSVISNLHPDKVLDPNNTGQMVDLLRGVIGAESGQKTLDWYTPQELTNAVIRARQP